jgi:hypothetical protein
MSDKQMFDENISKRIEEGKKGYFMMEKKKK